MTHEQHFALMRRCYELAADAVANGNHPFGALLVHQGKIVLEAQNTVHSAKDPTGHAELNLVRLAGQQFSPELLRECVLYTSTEPCVMCSGAIYWSGIGGVVYGCSETTLAQYAGADFLTPCREVFARGSRPVSVVGPILEAEGAHLHRKFWSGAPPKN
jgi:tRNA(Arg) A34 adenosine deaminase TadA